MLDSNSSDTSVNTVTSNVTKTSSGEMSENIDIMMILQSIIASVGIIANLFGAVVFMKHRKFSQKISNTFIINQVSNM